MSQGGVFRKSPTIFITDDESTATPINGPLGPGLELNLLGDGNIVTSSTGNTVTFTLVGGGSGTITGPESSTDNALVLWNGTDGTVIQNSNATLSDAGLLSVTELNLSTVLAYNYGGTQQSSYNKGDILYASAANTLSKLPIGANGEVLTVATDIPEWSAIAGSGDVTAAAVIGDNLLVRGDGAGKGVQNSGITVDDSDNITGVGTVDGRNLATDGTKLDGIEALADVTDETNVTAALPVSDATSLVKDPVDGTKTMRVDVGAVTTGTTRVLTMPDADVDLTNMVTPSSTNTLTNKTINTASNTITVVEADISDLGSYITAASTDTLTNKTFDANGTGNSLSNVDLTTDVIGDLPVTNLNAGIGASASTYWRGDGTWVTPAGSGDVSKVGTPVDNQIGVWTGDGTLEGDASFLWDGTGLKIEEVAAAAADTANFGQIWVKNTTPNQLWFTDDAGTDTQLGVGGGMPDFVVQWSAESLDVGYTPFAPVEQITTTNIIQKVRAFDYATIEYCSGKFEVPPDMDTTGTITFSVQWFARTVPAGSENVIWQIEHAAVATTEDLDSATFTAEVAAASATGTTQNALVRATWTETRANLGWVAGDTIFVKWSRKSTDANDTFDSAATTADDALLVNAAIIIPQA